jgi:hypothetical protein
LFKDAVSAWASNGKAKVNSEVEAVSRQTTGGLVGVQRMVMPQTGRRKRRRKKKKMMMMII